MSWLEELKPGDVVFVSSRGFGGGLSKVKIERLTKTQIITEDGKYRKDSGWLIGRGTWDMTSLCEPTEAVEAGYQEQLYQSNLRCVLDFALEHRKEIPHELGKQVVELLKDFTKSRS